MHSSVAFEERVLLGPNGAVSKDELSDLIMEIYSELNRIESSIKFNTAADHGELPERWEEFDTSKMREVLNDQAWKSHTELMDLMDRLQDITGARADYNHYMRRKEEKAAREVQNRSIQ